MTFFLLSSLVTEKIAGGTAACKRKDDPRSPDHVPQPKKPRLVFTDLQRRTLQAIFKVCSRVGVMWLEIQV